MSEPVLLLGDSGSGKSTSLRKLNPEETLLISVDGKRPPFSMKDWPKLTKENPKGSFYIPKRESAYGSIKGAIKLALEAGKDKIIIDDSQYLLANQFFARAHEKGFDKFNELGQHFWLFIDYLRSLPDNVTVYMLHHTDTNEIGHVKPKTIGKMLDDKGCVEGRFTICLLAKKVDDEHKIYSAYTGQPVVKAPMGMLEAEMDNDLAIIDQKIREYYGM